jgi:hypothetical protein
VCSGINTENLKEKEAHKTSRTLEPPTILRAFLRESSGDVSILSEMEVGGEYAIRVPRL